MHSIAKSMEMFQMCKGLSLTELQATHKVFRDSNNTKAIYLAVQNFGRNFLIYAK